jgi:hypothetical protein
MPGKRKRETCPSVSEQVARREWGASLPERPTLPPEVEAELRTMADHAYADARDDAGSHMDGLVAVATRAYQLGVEHGRREEPSDG